MSHMRWQCNSVGCFLQRRTDPVILDGCFPAGVTGSDVDVMVELGGHFLVVEFKRPGVSIPIGQLRAFKALVATGRFTVVIVYALEQHVQGWRKVTLEGLEPLHTGDVDALREHVKRWSAIHDNRPVCDRGVQRPAS